MRLNITKSQYLYFAVVLVCFSGATFLLALLVGQVLAWMTSTVSPFGTMVFMLILSVVVMGGLGLFGVYVLVRKVIFSDVSKVDSLIYFFVCLGITAALLPALVGLASLNFLLTLIGWSSIICALRLIYLSKKVKPDIENSPSIESEKIPSDRILVIRGALVSVSKFILFLSASPAMFLVLWLLARELTIVWYGFPLESRAGDRAEEVAEGKGYCLIASYGAVAFEELDKRTIISQAFDNHFGYSSFSWGYSMRRPHFGIKVEDASYFWSFDEDRFLMLPGYAGNYRCAEDIEPFNLGQSPL